MTYLAYAIGAIWSCGMLLLAGRVINSLRLTLNNLAPGADYWGPEYEAFRKGYYFSRIDPALFNESGRRHLQKLNDNSRIFNVWLIIGAILAISAAVYFVPR